MRLLHSRFDTDSVAHNVLLLFVLSTFVLALGIGMRSPWPADEPRFAEVAREMVESGQWLFPQRGGEYYSDKPPVFMWSVATVYALTHNLKVAFLLPSAVCALLTLLIVFDLGRRLWDLSVGRNAALLLLLVPQFLVQAKSGQIDAMLCCWVVCACYGLIRHYWLGPAWHWYYMAWCFMGLGIITKGVGILPILLLLPLAIQALYTPHLRPAWRWRSLAGPLFLLFVCGLWIVPMLLTVYMSGDEAQQFYAADILFRQTGERYVNSWAHVRPWHYFLTEVIPLLWLPLPLMAIAWARTLRQSIRTDSRITVLFAWVALVVLFFSLSPGKRNLYILPALPMACLAMAAALRTAQYHRLFERVMGAVLWLMAGLLAVLALFVLSDHELLRKQISDDVERFTEVAWLLLGMAFLWALALVWLRYRPALLRAGVLSLIGWSLAATAGYRLFDDMRTPRLLMQRVHQYTGESAELGLIDFKEQFLLFSPLDVTHFSYLASMEDQERNAWLWIRESAAKSRYVLVNKATPLSCFTHEHGIDAGRAHRRDWLLLPPESADSACPAPQKYQRYFTFAPAPRWL